MEMKLPILVLALILSGCDKTHNRNESFNDLPHPLRGRNGDFYGLSFGEVLSHRCSLDGKQVQFFGFARNGLRPDDWGVFADSMTAGRPSPFDVVRIEERNVLSDCNGVYVIIGGTLKYGCDSPLLSHVTNFRSEQGKPCTEWMQKSDDSMIRSNSPK